MKTYAAGALLVGAMRRNIFPPLSKQGLVLIAVPLVCELIFVCLLSGLLQRTEEQVKTALVANQVLRTTLALNQDLIAAVTALGAYALAGDNLHLSLYDSAIDRVPDGLGRLERFASADKRRVATLKQQVNSMVYELSEARKLVTQGFRAEARTSFTALQPELTKAKDTLQILLREQNSIIDSSTAAHEADNRLVFTLITGGVTANVGIAVFLALYFRRNTSARLQLLMDNTSFSLIWQKKPDS